MLKNIDVFAHPTKEKLLSILGRYASFQEECDLSLTYFLSRVSVTVSAHPDRRSQWLDEQGVPGVYGIDTRALTKRLRETGSMLGRLVYAEPAEAAKQEVVFEDPNARCVPGFALS
jgi:hypothetical protein